MDCAKSLEMLSEYRAGSLEEAESVFVRTHLSACKDCNGVFEDLNLIVQAALVLRNQNGIAYPDEHAVWQRLSLGKNIIH
jgi:anti-sigma factor ChrR (cupin superfamily)